MKLRFYFMAVLFLSCAAFAQEVPEDGISVVHPNVEMRVNGLPSLKAVTEDAPDVLATAVAMVFHDKQICCGRDSALEDRLPGSDPVSLKEVAAKVQGRQLLPDGRPMQITAEYVAPSEVNALRLVDALVHQRAAVFQWKSQIYTLYGAVYDEVVYASGRKDYEIHKLLLLDPRYSDSRREVEFVRPGDDLSKVQGLLFLSVSR